VPILFGSPSILQFLIIFSSKYFNFQYSQKLNTILIFASIIIDSQFLVNGISLIIISLKLIKIDLI